MVDFKALVPWKEKAPAPAPRHDFYDPFVTFRREVDRMFDDFFSGFGGGRALAASGPWPNVAPTMEIAETDKEILVTAELPGLDDKDFNVTVAGDVLTLKGEKRAEHEHRKGDTAYTERRFGAFSRSVRLPFEIGEEKVDATYHKGVLTIRVPKPADHHRTARRIDVKTV